MTGSCDVFLAQTTEQCPRGAGLEGEVMQTGKESAASSSSIVSVRKRSFFVYLFGSEDVEMEYEDFERLSIIVSNNSVHAVPP